MSRLIRVIFALVLLAVVSGCGRSIGGPRFWWDDRNQARLEDYELPAAPGAPADFGVDRGAVPSGEDLSEDDLRDYRTNLDQEEEKRKSESSLVDF
ncbi:MAG: hypothetical protein LIQ31_15975 [Planctomycetes bacterium]|nr:hypothetical protein [Planctomycetota bacterium]